MIQAWGDICVVETWSLSFPFVIIKCVVCRKYLLHGEEDFVVNNQD